MTLFESIRNSTLLRWPLIATTKLLLRPLVTTIPLFRRATYDASPTPYLVISKRELYIVSTRDRTIGRELFLHGEFDFYKLAAALEIIQREGAPAPEHLVDVGANIGTILIPAIKRGLVKSATAIEPHPDNIKLLRANIALNGISELVTVHQVAVGDRSDEVLKLKESASNSGNHSIGAHGISIHSTRLDDIEAGKKTSMLWMDIEGYEGHALEGARSFIAAGSPIVSEFNPSYLAASGGMPLFQRNLEGRRIYDLGCPPFLQTSLEDLTRAHKTTFTDILAL
ncbi:FkbM family methyltransferase [Luteimonas sp. A482]